VEDVAGTTMDRRPCLLDAVATVWRRLTAMFLIYNWTQRTSMYTASTVLVKGLAGCKSEWDNETWHYVFTPTDVTDKPRCSFL